MSLDPPPSQLRVEASGGIGGSKKGATKITVDSQWMCRPDSYYHLRYQGFIVMSSQVLSHGEVINSVREVGRPKSSCFCNKDQESAFYP